MSTASNQVTITTSYKDGNGTTLAKNVILTGDLVADIERLGLALDATDIEFDVSVPFAKIQAICIGCAKSAGQAANLTAGCKVKTNSNSDTAVSGTNDIFTGVVPLNGLVWSTGDPTPNPFTANVTKIYVSSTGTGKFDFFMRILLDSTPDE